MITSTIRTILLRSQPVVGFVANRIYPVEIPEDAVLPAIQILIPENESVQMLGGVVPQTKCTIEISVLNSANISTGNSTVSSIVTAVRGALENITFEDTVGGVSVIYLATRSFAQDETGSVVGGVLLYRQSIILDCWYENIVV